MYFITQDNIYQTKPENEQYECAFSIESAQDILKRNRINMIENKYNSLTNSRFDSDALGTVNYYDGSPTDRISLVGAVMEMTISGQARVYKTYSSQDINEMGTLVSHTPNQLSEVLKDGADLLTFYINKKDTLIKNIQNATTVQEIVSYVWD